MYPVSNCGEFNSVRGWQAWRLRSSTAEAREAEGTNRMCSLSTLGSRGVVILRAAPVARRAPQHSQTLMYAIFAACLL